MSILLSLQAVGAQTAEQMPDLTAVTVPTEAEINVIDLAFKGGWIMVVLLLLSLMAGYIFIQRLLVIRRAGKEDQNFMNRIKDYIHEGKVDSALNLCRSTNTPSARMIEKGITRLGRPMNDVLVAIENVGNLEIAKLEKGFPLIATTAAGAPMLGFLGTVTGMVRAFFDMANAGTNVDVSLLSGGIYEALVTTVGGLVVGIITLFAYNYLVSQVDNVVNKMEARTMEFIERTGKLTKRMALKRRTKVNEAFSMASMTDVIFLLLIFFMVTSTVVIPNAIKVTLPQAKKQTAAKPLTRVTIDANLNYYVAFGNQRETQVTFDEITPFLQDSYAKEPEMFVALYADETVPYKEIVKILNIANENKFKMVLATRAQK